jgi:hypothetical protein
LEDWSSFLKKKGEKSRTGETEPELMGKERLHFSENKSGRRVRGKGHFSFPLWL